MVNSTPGNLSVNGRHLWKFLEDEFNMMDKIVRFPSLFMNSFL